MLSWTLLPLPGASKYLSQGLWDRVHIAHFKKWPEHIDAQVLKEVFFSGLARTLGVCT
jgi:hypothetical protein